MPATVSNKTKNIFIAFIIHLSDRSFRVVNWCKKSVPAAGNLFNVRYNIKQRLKVVLNYLFFVSGHRTFGSDKQKTFVKTHLMSISPENSITYTTHGCQYVF